MNSNDIDQIRSADQEKIDIIKKIISYHPGYGTKRGYSYWTGGFVDSGDWKLEVLLSLRMVELQVFLNELTEIEKKGKEKQEREEIRSKEVAKMTPEEKLTYYRESKIERESLLNGWYEERMTKLMWGNGK